MLSMNNIKSVMINPILWFPIIPLKKAYIISHDFFISKTLNLVCNYVFFYRFYNDS